CEIRIGRYIHNGQNLFRYLVEDGRGNIAAVIRANRLVQYNYDDDRRIIYVRKSYERSYEFCLRVGLRLRVNLLRSACLASRRVAVELSLLRSPVQRYLFQHVTKRARRLYTQDLVLLRLHAINNCAVLRANLADQMWSYANTIIG